MNLAGANTISGNILFSNSTGTFPQVGIGVEQIYQTNASADANYSTPAPAPSPNINVVSQLTLTGTQSDGEVAGVTAPSAVGLIKLGSQRLVLQGPGTFRGNVDIQQGVVLDQNDTGLVRESPPPRWKWERPWSWPTSSRC